MRACACLIQDIFRFQKPSHMHMNIVYASYTLSSVRAGWSIRWYLFYSSSFLKPPSVSTLTSIEHECHACHECHAWNMNVIHALIRKWLLPWSPTATRLLRMKALLGTCQARGSLHQVPHWNGPWTMTRWWSLWIVVLNNQQRFGSFGYTPASYQHPVDPAARCANTAERYCHPATYQSERRCDFA